MQLNPGTTEELTLNQATTSQMSFKKEFFEYILRHAITNECHYNEHLKYETLVNLEHKIAPTTMPFIKLVAFNQTLQNCQRVNDFNQITSFSMIPPFIYSSLERLVTKILR